MVINTGIKANARKEIAAELCKVQADTFTLYLKTHKFHWNVAGPMFQTLHQMFEGQYRDLWEAVDSIAERIRALDVHAPGSYAEFAALTSIRESEGLVRANAMIRQLIEGHENLIHTARAALAAAESAGDAATVDLLAQRIRSHEKTAWMLRSMIDDVVEHAKELQPELSGRG